MVSNLEILKDILLKMKYDTSKTLNENLSEQNPEWGPTGFEQGIDSGKPSRREKEEGEVSYEHEERFEIWPIPDYKAYYTPKVGDSKGGLSYMYFPDGTQFKQWTFATPDIFSKAAANAEKAKLEPLTAELMQSLFPAGTIRSFTLPNGTKYFSMIRIGDSTNYKWNFAGYFDKDRNMYQSPKAEDYMSWWDTIVQNSELFAQILISLIAAIALEAFTAGAATPLVTRLLLEFLIELAIAVPFAYSEYKSGDKPMAYLSLAFSLLPFVNARTLGLKKISKEVASSLSEKVAKHNISDAASMAKFYDDVLVGEEKYIFSRLMRQEPDVLRNAMGDGLKNILKSPEARKQLMKIALKDQRWYVDLGLPLSVAFVSIILVEISTENYSEQELKRMVAYLQSIEDQLGVDTAESYTQKMIEDPNLINDIMSDLSNDDTESIGGIVDSLVASGIQLDDKTKAIAERAKLDSLANYTNVKYDLDSIMNLPFDE